MHCSQSSKNHYANIPINFIQTANKISSCMWLRGLQESIHL